MTDQTARLGSRVTLRLLAILALCLVPMACARSSRPVAIVEAINLAESGKAEAAKAKLAAAAKLTVTGIDDMVADARRTLSLWAEVYVEVDAEFEKVIAKRSKPRAQRYAVERANTLEAEAHSSSKSQETTRDAARSRMLAHAWRVRVSDYDQIAKRVDREDQDASGSDEQLVSQGSEDAIFGAALEHALTEIDELEASGEFRAAAAKLADLQFAPGSDVGRLRDRLHALHGKGKVAIDKVRRKVRELEVAGKLGEARDLLSGAAARFPETGPIGGLMRDLARLERELRPATGEAASEIATGMRKAASPETGRGDAETGTGGAANEREDQVGEVDKAETAKQGRAGVEGGAAAAQRGGVSKSTLAAVDQLGDDPSKWGPGYRRRVRREIANEAKLAYEQRDYREASELYARAALLAKGLHFESTYRRLAADAKTMQLTLVALANAIRAKPDAFASVDLGYGERAKLLGIEGGKLRVESAGAEKLVPLKGIPDQAFAPLLAKVASTAQDFLATGALYARVADAAKAEQHFLRALAADKSLKPQIDALLARLRNEDPGAGGYQVVEGRFVSSRAIFYQGLRTKLASTFSRLWTKRDDKSRDREYNKLLAEDARAVEIVVTAFRERKVAIHKRLSATKLVKRLEKLRALRVELDKRRAHALELIFDSRKYFYPYRPPAVSGAKAKEYALVQQEVDRRVAAVHEIWNDERSIEMSKAVARDVALYGWLTIKLKRLGANTVDLDKGFMSLLARGKTTIRNVALDENDRRRIDGAEDTVKKNAKLFARMHNEGTALATETELIRRTNEYRMSMGRHPLRSDVRLIEAAHGHCKEMSDLGYFGHYSPTPGRKSPADRMRLAGYPRGGGENLAVNSSPESAVWAWRHSSGHHRNMLSSAHRDLGTGNVGRYWAQNFGSGGSSRRR